MEDTPIEILPETDNTTNGSTASESVVVTGTGSAKEKPSENPKTKLKFVRLPISKIKQIMKMDPDCSIVQYDAVFLVTKATEMFINFMTTEANKQLSGNKRKTLMKRDIDATIESIPHLCFLDGALE